MSDSVASGAAPAEDGAALSRTVVDLIDVAARDFVGSRLPAPSGVLDLPVDAGLLRSIRLELPPGQALGLQTARIDTPKRRRPCPRRPREQLGRPRRAGPRRLRSFDLDHPTGTALLTKADRPGLGRARPPSGGAGEPDPPPERDRRDGARRARPADHRQGPRAHARPLRRWRPAQGVAPLVTAATAGAASDPTAIALLDVLSLTVRGDYARAHRSLVAHVDDEAQRRQFRASVNEALLPRGGSSGRSTARGDRSAPGARRNASTTSSTAPASWRRCGRSPPTSASGSAGLSVVLVIGPSCRTTTIST